MTRRDVEQIVQSVLKDYGLVMQLREVTPKPDVWDVVLLARDGAAVHIPLAAGNSPHGVRRALMRALELDS